MTPYQIQGPARSCNVSGRELTAGEKIYSVLFDEAGQLVRRDYAADAWPGPPEQAIAWWSGRIPASDRPRRPTINDDLLLDCFSRLGESHEPGQLKFRYVVALLLMRKKRFRFEDVIRRDGEEYMLLRDAKSAARHEVLDPHLSDDEISAVQDDVFRVLGWE